MIEIKPLAPTKGNVKKFVKFERDLYRGNRYYVPPLLSSELDNLLPERNPAFEFCEAEYFMAYRDGEPVGRIVVMINRQINEIYGQNIARFGWIDFIDDPEVAAALLRKAEDWARQRGMKKLVGPLGFTDMDREGTLVEGFDELSTMATIYNHPYYEKHIRAAGYEKDSDWMEFLMEVPEGIPDKYNRVADIVKQRFGLKVVKYTSRKHVKEDYGHALFRLINEAYKDLYQYSPLTERQIDKYINDYLGLLNLDLLTLIVDRDRKLVGVGVALPSMSRALQKSHGKMFPFGWYHLLKGLKGVNDRVDLLLVAVAPYYQNKGVNALLFQDLIPQFIKYGYKYAESNPELESNAKVQSQWEFFSRRQHRRRRSFFKDL
ncbi:MAG: GNAT family N-acetyltransferase [Muribaculaceae bacterium]|nr:GNAT family N-acetyltransferase [Muribaculaceae bacterium]